MALAHKPTLELARDALPPHSHPEGLRGAPTNVRQLSPATSPHHSPQLVARSSCDVQRSRTAHAFGAAHRHGVGAPATAVSMVETATTLERHSSTRASPSWDKEALRKAVLMGAFGFESYSDPNVNAAIVVEMDGWEHPCVTTYTSRDFAREQFSGLLTVRLREAPQESEKDNARAKVFAVVRVGQQEKGDQGDPLPVQKWCVAKTSTIRSHPGKQWGDEVTLPVQLASDRDSKPVLQILVFRQEGFVGLSQVLSQHISLDKIQESLVLDRDVSVPGGPLLHAQAWYQTFEARAKEYSASQALGVYPLFRGQAVPIHDLAVPAAAFPHTVASETVGGSGDFGGPGGVRTGLEGQEEVSWAEVPMTLGQRRAVRYLFGGSGDSVLVPFGALLAAVEGKKGMQASSLAGFEKICFLHGESSNTDCAVWRDVEARAIVVAFRGTEATKVADVVTDINAIMTPWKDLEKASASWRNSAAEWGNTLWVSAGFLLGMLRKQDSPDVLVHQGFLKGYKSVRAQLLHILRVATKEGGPWSVYITGHSLGGALATLCAYDLVKSGVVPSQSLSVRTFGSPRVGNAAFAQEFDSLIKDSVRFVNEDDIVPTVPRLQGFVHVDSAVCLNPNREGQHAVLELPGPAGKRGGGVVSDFKNELEMWEDVKGGWDSPGIQTHLTPFYYLSLLHLCEKSLPHAS